MRAACVLLALALAACATVIRYPKSWDRPQPVAACEAIAGIWADAGDYVGDKGGRRESLAKIFSKVSDARPFNSGDGFVANGHAVRIESLGKGRLSVRQVPASEGARGDSYECKVVDGWAEISGWNFELSGSGGGGFSIAPPLVTTHTESLRFRKAKDGSLIARLVTRERNYLLIIPLDENYLRWARFRPYKPVAQSSR